MCVCGCIPAHGYLHASVSAPLCLSACLLFSPLLCSAAPRLSLAIHIDLFPPAAARYIWPCRPPFSIRPPSFRELTRVLPSLANQLHGCAAWTQVPGFPEQVGDGSTAAPHSCGGGSGATVKRRQRRKAGLKRHMRGVQHVSCQSDTSGRDGRSRAQPKGRTELWFMPPRHPPRHFPLANSRGWRGT